MSGYVWLRQVWYVYGILIQDFSGKDMFVHFMTLYGRLSQIM